MVMLDVSKWQTLSLLVEFSMVVVPYSDEYKKRKHVELMLTETTFHAANDIELLRVSMLKAIATVFVLFFGIFVQYTVSNFR
jgi:hypothetical protein